MLAFLSAALSAAPADAQARIRVGVLSCRGSSSSFIVGSVTSLGCTFQPSAGGAERYSATVRRVGLDVGTPSRTALSWIVLAPTNRIGPGELSGSYGGVSAGAAVGVGGGANVLVGGSRNSIALQPLSVQGGTGVNLAVGIAGLELRGR